MVARRTKLLNYDYESKLNMLNRNGSLSEQLNALVSAFISPLINRGQESPAWMNYLRLLSRNNSLSLFSNISDFSIYFQPIKEKFTQELAELFPASSEKKIFSAYQLMSSCTMSQLSSELEIEQDIGNTEKSLELEKKMNEILNFVKGGILELLNEADQNLRHSNKALR